MADARNLAACATAECSPFETTISQPAPLPASVMSPAWARRSACTHEPRIGASHS